MAFYSSYYVMLNVADSSSMEEIKASFRRLSLEHHPDKNENSAESNARFILLLNAYNTLIDPEKRKEYDTYLSRSTALNSGKKPFSGTQETLLSERGGANRSYEALLNHFNFLLWDIEDFIRDRNEADWERRLNEFSLRQHILIILTFIDKWVLEPSGNPDYFMEARKMEKLDPRDYIHMIGDKHKKFGHSPYAGVLDYFYDLRKRMDKLLEKTTISELVMKIPNYDLRLIDCVIEAQNLTVHYLSYLLQLESGRIEDIPPFNHSHPCFYD